MERDELEIIYRKYYRQLYLYALSLCKNRSDADDLVQSAFLKAFLSWQPGGSIRLWLTRVLQNEYFNLYRKRKKLVGETESIESRMPEEEGLLEGVIKGEMKQQLFYQIMALPTIQKQVMMSSIYFELKDEEIAESLQISRENVRKLRSRAREKIRKGMEEAGYGDKYG